MTNISVVIGWKHNHQSGMSRSLEDLITDKFDGDAGTSLQERYDKKIKIRGEQPE